MPSAARLLLVSFLAFIFLYIRPGAAEESLRPESFDFLKRFLATPTPSGFEQPAQKIWMDYVGAFAAKPAGDVQGNAIGVIHPQGTPRVMFAGHCDEIGFIVRYIDDRGYLSFDAIGGFDQPIIPGRIVEVHTSHGPVLGVIGKIPIHLIKEEDRNRGSRIDDLWIDIGARDKKEAESLVMLGDPVTYPGELLELRNGLYTTRGFDDRIGSFIVAETLRELARSKSLQAAVYSVSTTQEEIGASGARTSTFGIDPLVGVAVDVTFAADQPGVEKKEVGDIVLGGGPVISRGPHINPRVFDLLMETAKKKNIPYQIEIDSNHTGTDADVMYISRAGVAAGVVSIPLRNMHTPVEVLSMSDVVNTIRLLTAFSEAVRPDMKFIP
jgi:tetrahedral aminopeptidase